MIIEFVDEVKKYSANDFCAKLNAVPSRSAVDIYISTPGGDIFAGGEMVNAVEHAIERGCKLNFELGAIVASMGASLIAAARARGCRVTARSNTQMMYHGCYGTVCGGADELTDEAKLMRDFNSNVIANLKKCGITDCEEWFAADRQKWLNAEEIVALNLADAIAGVDDTANSNNVTVANRYAAKWSGAKDMPIPEETQTETPVAEVTEVVAETVTETTPENTAETPVEEAATVADMVTREEADKRVQGMQAAMQRQINELNSQLASVRDELTQAQAEVTRVTAERDEVTRARDELTEQVTSITAERDSAKDALAKLNGAVNKVNAKPKVTWTDARAHLASLPMAERKAFYQAHRAEIDNQ